MMFALKKIITPFVLPPGIFIVALGIAGLWLIARRRKKAALFCGLAAIALWLCSIAPLSNALMKPLEYRYPMPANPQGDVIILLGGGSISKAPDLNGEGVPTTTMLARIVTTARLQKRLNVPIIVSGGRVFADRPAEAPIAKRVLVDLGVPANQVITESQSRDTRQNAYYSHQICKARGFNRPLVVTSAGHLWRAALSFQKQGLPIQLFPADYRTSPVNRYAWYHYLPNAGSLSTVSRAMHEYIGLLYYHFS